MTAKLIVADAGPLIALAVGGVLPACVQMLGGLAVPEAVLVECTADPSASGAAVIAALCNTAAIDIVPQALLTPLDAALAQGLGSGELAVLAYAAEHGFLALIDERRARKVALRLNVAVIGSGTLLAQLAQLGLIDSLEPVFAAWHRHGYFVSPAVQAQIVQLASVPATGLPKRPGRYT
jgi:predicted nucleic acid-binding protein